MPGGLGNVYRMHPPFHKPRCLGGTLKNIEAKESCGNFLHVFLSIVIHPSSNLCSGSASFPHFLTIETNQLLLCQIQRHLNMPSSFTPIAPKPSVCTVHPSPPPTSTSSSVHPADPCMYSTYRLRGRSSFPHILIVSSLRTVAPPSMDLE